MAQFDENDALDQDTPEERQRMRDALGGTPGICRSISPDGAFMCWLDVHGEEVEHYGFELPTMTIDEVEHVVVARSTVSVNPPASTLEEGGR